MTPGGAAKPADVVAAVIAAIRADVEEVFPDGMAREVGPVLDRDYRSVEKQFAQFLPG
jgi:hypothetical protein